MAEDELKRLLAEGFALQERFDREYWTREREGSWVADRDRFFAQWRGTAAAWVEHVERALRGDTQAVVRFRNAPVSPLMRHNTDPEWNVIVNTLTAKLTALDQLIDRRGPGQSGNVHIEVVGSANFGTVHGDMRTSVRTLVQGGEAELARLFEALLERIPSVNLPPADQEAAAQLTASLAQEVAKQPGGGRLASVRPLATALREILAKSADLAQIWQAIEPHLKRWLG